MKPATVLLSGALLLSAAGGVSAQTPGVTSAADIAKAGMDPERLARIPVRIREFVEKGTIAGAVTLVARHGVVASLEAVGYQDLETKAPMRTDTIFQVRDMVKSVTAVGIMILLEEGRLLLTDRVEKHLPEFRGQTMVNGQKPSRPITIHDLLTHTSGMLAGGQPPPDGLKGRDLRDVTLAEIARVLANEPLEFEPGTKYHYSTMGFRILDRIIEVASGQPAGNFREQRIFRPLGMKDTFTAHVAPEKRERIASLYQLWDGQLKKSASDLYRRPPNEIYSTAMDVFVFYQMMLNGGTYKGTRILSRAAVEAMTAAHTGDLPASGSAPTASGPSSRPEQGYGLGWFIVRGPSPLRPLDSIATYTHFGGLGTRGWVDSKKDLVGMFMMQLGGPGPDRLAARDTFSAMTAAAVVD